MNKTLHNRIKKGVSLFVLLIMLSAVVGRAYATERNISPNSALIEQVKNTKISLELSDKSFSEIMAEICRRGDVKYGVDRGVNIDNSVKHSLKVVNTTIENTLNQFLNDKPYGFTYDNGTILIVNNQNSNTVATTQQEKWIISGKVVNEQGEPITGVTLIVRGTPEGAITDNSGSFLLGATVGAIIDITFMGMKAVEYKVTGPNDNLVITMVEDATKIEDVVVTGIFNKSRESYTGAVTTVTKKDMAMFRGQNMLQTLANIDPAFRIAQDNLSGSNPNRTMEVTIRGNSSLPANLNDLESTEGSALNQPLVIMDGFEITMDRLMDMNDERIESITILKDASSTAIYGSRGANGVIVIKTKDPLPGRLTVNVNAGLTFEVPDLSSYNLMGAVQKLELEKMVGLYTSTNPSIQMGYNNTYNQRLSEAMRGETEWIREPVRVGVGRRVSVDLEGGTDEFRWGLSANNNVTTGAMKGSDRETSGAVLTLMYNYKNFRFRNQATLDITTSDNGTYGSFSDYAQLNAYNRPYDENGNLIKTFEGTSVLGNPLYDATLNGIDVSTTTTISNVLSADWTPVANLNIRGQLGLSKTFDDSDYFAPADHSMFVEQADLYKKGLYTMTTGDGYSIDASLNASWNKTFKEKHLVSAGVDLSARQSEGSSYAFSTTGFINPDFDNITNGIMYQENSLPTGSETIKASVGFAGTFNYTFDERLFVDGSYRVDGSSQFGKDNRFAPFWSIGAGWNLHKEKFMENSKIFNEMRLRFSTGESGSQQFSSFDALQTYGVTTTNIYYYWGSAYLMGLGNDNLTWQTTGQQNIGLDFRLLNSRISGAVDVFYKRTDDLVSSISLPQSYGFSSYSENVGSTESYGYEAQITGQIIRNTEKGLLWNVTGRLSYTTDRIVELSDDIKEQTALAHETSEYATLLYEGKSMNSLYAVQSMGIDPISGQELFLDKDGVITSNWSPNARIYVGESQPLYQGNISSMLQYKNFILNLSFAYHFGGVQYNSTLLDKVECTIGDMVYNVDQRVYDDRWQEPGDVTYFKGYSYDATKSSTRFVMDDRSFSLQSASIQYRWNTPFVREKLNATSIMFSLNANELFYFSTIKRERGIDYPFANNIQFAVSLNF